MPDKITSKNLSYDQTLPPFLARLRGQQVSHSQSPDPILAARSRNGHVRSASEEAEDAPIVVDEEGNVVQLNTAQLGEERQEEEENEKSGDAGAGEHGEKVARPAKLAGIGAAKKRKLGRVVGGGDGDDDGRDGIDLDFVNAVKATKTLAKQDTKKDDPKPATKGVEKSTPQKSGKKKAKKIKLSFRDDDDG